MSYRLYDYVRKDQVRVESRPAPDTIVLRTYGYREVLHGRTFTRVRTRVCGRMRVHATLHPSPGDPLKLAAALLPDADDMTATSSTGTVEPLGSSVRPPQVKVRLDRELRHWRVGATAAQTVLTDWHQDGQDGFAALTAVGTVLSTAAGCRRDVFYPLPFSVPQAD